MKGPVDRNRFSDRQFAQFFFGGCYIGTVAHELGPQPAARDESALRTSAAEPAGGSSPTGVGNVPGSRTEPSLCSHQSACTRALRGRAPLGPGLRLLPAHALVSGQARRGRSGVRARRRRRMRDAATAFRALLARRDAGQPFAALQPAPAVNAIRCRHAYMNMQARALAYVRARSVRVPVGTRPCAGICAHVVVRCICVRALFVQTCG